jgi:hypothetical protein
MLSPVLHSLSPLICILLFGRRTKFHNHIKEHEKFSVIYDILIFSCGDTNKIRRGQLWTDAFPECNDFIISDKIKNDKSYLCDRQWRPTGLWDIKNPTFSRQSTHRWRWGCQPYASLVLYSPGRFLVLISVRGWVDKLWEPRRLTTLWASTTCYKDSFTFLPFISYLNASFQGNYAILWAVEVKVRQLYAYLLVCIVGTSYMWNIPSKT